MNAQWGEGGYLSVAKQICVRVQIEDSGQFSSPFHVAILVILICSHVLKHVTCSGMLAMHKINVGYVKITFSRCMHKSTIG